MDAVISIGEKAPHFVLPDQYDQQFSLDGWDGWIRVLYFWSAECIWCERVDLELIGLLDSWEGQVKCVWIASNANESPELIAK
ncbi:MAG TPA: redoxin domain-containing protein, partial [Anaerolineales bacterium]